MVEESDGVVGYDVMKTKSSFRTLPLLPNIREALLEEKAKQKEMQEMFGKGYNKGIPMKMIQDWLGHSDMSTTANIYSHIDSTSKKETAQAIGELLG